MIANMQDEINQLKKSQKALVTPVSKVPSVKKKKTLDALGESTASLNATEENEQGQQSVYLSPAEKTYNDKTQNVKLSRTSAQKKKMLNKSAKGDSKNLDEQEREYSMSDLL